MKKRRGRGPAVFQEIGAIREIAAQSPAGTAHDS